MESVLNLYVWLPVIDKFARERHSADLADFLINF